MPSEANALAAAPVAPARSNESDYQAFCDALASSARGRWFLGEYARRNRNADTEILLAALARLEAHLRADSAAAGRLRDELRMLLIAIRLARPELDAATVPVRAAKLRELLDLLERRIETMTETAAAPAPAVTADPADATLRPRLAVVPRPEEPELPIPSPAAQPPAIALVAQDPAGSAAIIPEVTVFSAPKDASATQASPPADPLAALMALTEEERLALFT